MQDHVLSYLIKEGWVSPEGLGRRAVLRLCRGCRMPVLRASTAPPMAETVTVVPWPLGALGEAVARLTGLQTYDLRPVGDRLELTARNQWHIRGSPADRPDAWRRHGDVVAEHRCGIVWLPTVNSRLPRKSIREYDEPPF